jgi:hypothetical protein
MRKRLVTLALVLALALFGAACDEGDEDEGGDDLTAAVALRL